MNTFEQVKEKALPLIEAYHNDLLIHDKISIEENPKVPFLHFTGDTGTHMIRLIPAKEYPTKGEEAKYLFGMADRYHILSQVVDIVRYMPQVNRRGLILYFDGKKLHEINQKKAEIIAEDYKLKILREWYK